ncbi:Acylphosphatase [Halobacterium jilantaiense]|uniref:acylphosphatase n=1 Tax=Halobacterium jilantaiense TaxID=355548 RepID=A0A1I0MIX5_9EURY|nr:Acylphosphatase [Halobacterium jilantaiense]
MCANRHGGRRLLNLVRDDHRYCYTCFSRLKDIQEPTEEWRTRKSTPQKIALDQGASFEQAAGGSLILDATACGYGKIIDPESVTGCQYATERATTGEVRVERGGAGRYYRVSTRDAAREAGVDGWVRNLPDGRIETVFEGDEAAVEAMVEWCHEGSSAASSTASRPTTRAPRGSTASRSAGSPDISG